VTLPEDQLREAFQAHEGLAPDAAEVYARVQQLSRTYLWRRRGAQVAGGAVLGAGLIAGAFQLPGLLPGSSDTVNVPVAASPASPAAASPSASAVTPPVAVSPTGSTTERRRDAFFAAGYDYDDAVKLARLWHKPVADIDAVKAEAGRRLLARQTLPVKPKPGNVVSAKETQQVEAFFAAGYDVDDAIRLSRLWKTADAYHAKVEGGKRLLAGDTLPIRP
jgi:hypothetical protein